MKMHGRYQCREKENRRRPPRSVWWLLLGLWLAGALPELLLHLLTAKGEADLWNGGLALSALFSLVAALVLFAAVAAMPFKRLRYWICFGYSFFMLLLCGSQLVYYDIFGTFYSAFSAANGGQVLEFWYIALQSIGRNFLWLLLMALPFIGFCVFGRSICRIWHLKYPWVAVAPAVTALVLQLALVMSLSQFGGTGAATPYDLYHHNADSYLSVNRLGLATAFRLDVTRLLTGQQPQGSIDIGGSTVTMPPLTTAPSTESTEPSDTHNPESSESTQTQPTETEPEPTVDTGPNVLDIDFDSLIAQEGNDAVRQVHQFFQSRTPSNKNEKTGIFAGCNLVMITAEAFSDLIVTPERTPILYKMMHEGYYFTDYYVPTWGASTTDGEYCFLTGTYPKSNVWSFAETADNYMPLTMSMQLQSQGYNTYAYHGHTYSYYKRDQYLPNIFSAYRGYGGSSAGKGVNGLPIQYTWPESDLEVVDVTTADYVGNAPFVAYYMSISGHMNFDFSGNVISRKNREYVENEPYSEAIQAYIACQLELEFSLELLMQRLEEAGQLENTVFVLTADHYPYGLTDGQISELLGHEVETNFELYKNGCIIYKPGMTPETVTKPCSHFDILPTLSNLFGLEFDSRLYMGRDVFSDAPGLVVFPNYSWITDYASFNARTGKIENRTEYAVTKEYTDSVMRDVTNRFAVSIRILDYDYWRILFG